MKKWQSKFSPYANRIVPSAIFALSEMPRAPDTINLGPGEPDVTLFPARELNEAFSSTLQDPVAAATALQYTAHAGEPLLRERICQYMRTKGVDCSPRNILVTNGAQQALDLLTELFVTPSTTLVAQTPTYTGALGIFRAHGAHIVSLDRFRDTPSREVAMIYANSNFHNPTGVSLSVQERLDLIKLAQDVDAVLIEDDCYETLSFDEAPSRSMLALETSERSIEDAHTVYISTFSKSVCPGLRVGWIVAPSAMIEQLSRIKQSEDFQAGTLVQVCVAKVMDFIMEEHVPKLRDTYRARRDTMLSALLEHFSTDVQWSKPSGGFFVWLTLPPHLDAGKLLFDAAVAGVTYVPGTAFSHDGSYSNAMRLSYSSVKPDHITEGIRRLAAVVATANRRAA